ncbi:ABC transporter ATP-binding protein [Alicyclobacillus curvatus]|nr:ABC transporter ATP-binding protein [Alicyclobacillus curvatus]
MTNVLEVQSLSVEFNVNGRYLPAVSDVSLAIAEGETLGLVGESGCGKSVTSLAITRLLAKTARVGGKAHFGDLDLLTAKDKDMQRIRGNEISMIFQEPMTSLNPVYTIGGQISETLLLHKDISPREAFSQSLDMLKKVGISRPEQIMHQHPHQLSGGMRQRVMIAIAMACNPRLLIADEPTTALDVTIQAQILELMKGIARDFRTSLLLITHDLGVVAEMCDRVAVMYAGQVVEQGTVDEVFFNPQHPYTRGLLNAIPKFDAPTKARLQPIEGNVPSISRMPKGCRFSPRCPHVMNQCVERPPGLFDVDDAHLSRCWLNAEKEA